MGYLSGYLAFMAGIFLLLYWLFQPVTVVNAGVAAYVPPAKTRLVPGPRKMDAPELVGLEPLPRVEQSPLQALAKGSETSTATPPKQATRKRARKRPRYEEQVEIQQRRWGFAPDRDRPDRRYRRDNRYRDNGRSRQRNGYWQRDYRPW